MRRFALGALCFTVLALVACAPAADEDTPGEIEVEAADETADAPADADAGRCVLSDDPDAWGTDGNSGWARQYLLGECALTDQGVITYIELAEDCALRTDEASCVTTDLLGACGGTQVALVPAECRDCLPACVDSAATCDRGRCSNRDQQCDNDQQCSFSRAEGGTCSTGSSLVETWADYYTLMGGTGAAPQTYCSWV